MFSPTAKGVFSAGLWLHTTELFDSGWPHHWIPFLLRKLKLLYVFTRTYLRNQFWSWRVRCSPLTHCVFNVHFNIILPYKLWNQKWYSPFRVPTKTFLCVSSLVLVVYVSAHLVLIDDDDDNNNNNNLITFFSWSRVTYCHTSWPNTKRFLICLPCFKHYDLYHLLCIT